MVNLTDKNKNLLWLAACLISGAVTVLAFAPFDYFFIPFITLGLLFYRFKFVHSAMQSFLTGYCFGLGLFGTGVSWLHISINLFGGVPFVAAIGITVLLVLFLSLYPALAGWLSYRYRQCQTFILLFMIMPASWTLMEWFRSWIFTGFPWLNLGYSQTDTPLAGMAPITGIYGVTWITAMTAGLLCLIPIGRKREKILSMVALLCIWAFTLQSDQTEWTRPKDKVVSVALIQGGIPQELKWLPEQREKTIKLYMDLTRPYWDHDLIVWPETAIPMFYHEAGNILATIRAHSDQYGSHLLSGMAYMAEDKQNYYNSLILFGDTDSMYFKQHLVPFGEYLPFDQWLRPVLHFLNIPMSSFSSGEQEQPVLIAAGEVLGVSICYEDVFGEEVIRALPQAGILVNVSNDAWFGDSLAPHQHLQMARMRSIETGRYMIRATNTGISAVIDHKGKVTGASPQFTAHALSANVVPYEGSTPYSKTGNLFIIGMMIAILGLCIPRKKHVPENRVK